MTAEQQNMITLLSRVTFLPATFDKRFACDLGMKLAEEKQLKALGSSQTVELTEKQDECLRAIVHRYRRQHNGCRCKECRP